MVGVLFAPACNAADAADYLQQIKPVLQARCYACHGVLKQEGGLRLDTAAQLIQGGDSGAAVKAGEPAASVLVERISAEDESERMPPEGEPLKPQEIAAIKAWITAGAAAPADEKPDDDPSNHWAFRTPVRPTVPKITGDWGKNPIDAFIAAKHQEHRLSPQPLADKRLWLRRVTLDLVGLPPTTEQIAAFVADDSTTAHEKVVDRLLNSPQYAERWGRHWMDVWRYSDWWGLGKDVRNSQKHVWHWRDWIIDSLEEDKGYDQMVREMLAADELYPNDLDRLRASGFLVRSYFKFNRTTWLDDTVEHTAKAMLGLTFNCAKCHDHKYDPISHENYYQFRAIFEPYQVRTDYLPGQLDVEQDGLPRAFDCNLDTKTYRHIRGDDRNPDESTVMEPTVPDFLMSDLFAISPVELPPEAYRPGLRSHVVQDHQQAAQRNIELAQAKVTAAIKTREAAAQAEPARLAAEKAAAEKAAKPEPTPPMQTKGKPLVSDDFSMARPDVWEMVGGEWKYENGKLIQSKVGAQRASLRLKPSPPIDFQAKLKYKPTGGQKWKSVGITFDVDGQDNEVLVYLSSVKPGSKAQISYKQNGAHVYPAGAAHAQTVAVNEPHELLLQVRGKLINVSVDGKHVLAFQLPLPRKSGSMNLIAFDAAAEFLSFELSELPQDVVLTDAATPMAPTDKSSTPSLPEAKLALAIAQQTVIVAKAKSAAISLRAAADKARILSPDSAETKQAVEAAARATRAIELAQAELKVLQAELVVLKAPDAKKAEMKKQLDAAMAAVPKAKAALAAPGESYESLRGAKKTPESNIESAASQAKPFPQISSGRRTALANWLTHPQHPLTARVAVNHIWLRHLGQPLTPTVFNFGLKGSPPTHPELLDYLAVEFREHDWSMKHLHRLIVLSQTYRLSSSSANATDETLAADPENRYYWRSNPIRMEAQTVRDSLLSLSGELDLTRGGPPIPVAKADSKRRSLYFVHSHNDHQKFLDMFDNANVLECYRRAESITPQQALALANSAVSLGAAEKIAQRLAANDPKANDAAFIHSAFLTVLGVPPNDAEQAVAAAALTHFAKAAEAAKRPHPQQQARVNLIHALLNHNDFVTIR